MKGRAANTVADLLARVRECRFTVEVIGDAPRLVQAPDGGGVMPPDLLAELKRRRAQVIAHLTTCAVCRRDVSDGEYRDRLAFLANPFCDRSNCPYVEDRPT